MHLLPTPPRASCCKKKIDRCLGSLVFIQTADVNKEPTQCDSGNAAYKSLHRLQTSNGLKQNAKFLKIFYVVVWKEHRFKNKLEEMNIKNKLQLSQAKTEVWC